MFKDSNGKVSMTRILALVTCLTGLALAIIGGITGNSNPVVILGLVTLGFAGKVTGAKFENGGLSFETETEADPTEKPAVEQQHGGSDTWVDGSDPDAIIGDKIGFGK
jgi:hypothetical protein